MPPTASSTSLAVHVEAFHEWLGASVLLPKSLDGVYGFFGIIEQWWAKATGGVGIRLLASTNYHNLAHD